MKILIACLLISSTLYAQTLAQSVTVTTGPVTTTNKLAWSMSNGDTAVIAQAFEARVRIDGSTTPLVLPNVSCLATSLVDASGAAWTLGTPAAQTVLRNGQATAGFGNSYSLVNGIIYVLGPDANWYKWTGTTFTSIVATDPTPTILQGAAVSRWSCQANLSQAVVVALNVMGPHTTVLRLYDTVAKTCGSPSAVCESADSAPFTLSTPEVVTQPVTVRIVQ